MTVMSKAQLAAIAAALAGCMAAAGPLAAQTYWDFEAARANARAGGPTNAYDADLLRSYGCLSGTRSAFCQRLSRGDNSRRYYRYRRAR
jgi:hypothetical protein